ncbi:MAG: hypothetical protein WCF12_05865 [Propionicimonas sp.]
MRVATGGEKLGPVWLAWADPGTFEATLSSVDQTRLAGFDPVRQQAFRAGRALLTRLVEPLAPPASRWQVTTGPCQHCGQPHGPVTVLGVAVRVSVSYSTGIVVAAAASASEVGRLGVDVEVDRPDPVRDAHLRGLLGDSPEPALRRWCRVEAVLKADGRGLRVDPGTVTLPDPRFEVRDAAGPPGFLISLAWTSTAVSAARCGAATR